MPKIVDAEAQRSRIKRAARKVFARRGLRGTGLAHVAAAAGMGRANLYHYYPDKAALVRDLADDLLSEEEALFVAALTASGSAPERVEQLAVSVVRRFAAWRDLGGTLLQIWADDTRRVRPIIRRLRQTLAELIHVAQQSGELPREVAPLEAATLIVAMIDGLMVQVFLDPAGLQSSAALERALVRALWAILRVEQISR